MTRQSEIWLYTARRLIGTLPLLVGVGVFTFVLVRILPGDPAAYYATGPLATQEEIAQVRQALGLDRPWPEQLAALSSRHRLRRPRPLARDRPAGRP